MDSGVVEADSGSDPLELLETASNAITPPEVNLPRATLPTIPPEYSFSNDTIPFRHPSYPDEAEQNVLLTLFAF